MLFSIVIEYNDDTFVIQCEADTPDEAIRSGIKSHINTCIHIFDESEMLELVSEIENKDKLCTAINGLRGVWVDTFLVQENLVQVHTIASNEII